MKSIFESLECKSILPLVTTEIFSNLPSISNFRPSPKIFHFAEDNPTFPHFPSWKSSSPIFRGVKARQRAKMERKRVSIDWSIEDTCVLTPVGQPSGCASRYELIQELRRRGSTESSAIVNDASHRAKGEEVAKGKRCDHGLRWADKIGAGFSSGQSRGVD